MNYNDRSDGSIWGDGAAAAVVSPRKPGKLKVLYSVFDADPTRSQAVIVDTYGHFTQDGRAVRDFSVRQTVRLLKALEEQFAIDWNKDIFVGHQANATMLFGELHSLDDIEHEMIRKWFNEPRIHFALVCAAKSCPPLRNEAFVAARLETQLSDAARNFLSDKDRNYFDGGTGTLYLSSIFKWYGDDFNKTHGSAKQFIAKVIAGSKIEEVKIANEKTPVEYLNYDWTLNDASND